LSNITQAEGIGLPKSNTMQYAGLHLTLLRPTSNPMQAYI